MFFLSSVLILGLVRVMVEGVMHSLLQVFRLNHIVLPPPGWELEVIKFIISLLVATPIITTIAALEANLQY